MKLLPCATPYLAVLPAADDLEKHLETLRHQELPLSAPSGSGFVSVAPSSELVYEFPGGYAFALQIDEKVLPSSVVKTAVKKWADQFTENMGYAPGRKATKEARERIVANLLTTAMVKSKIVTCLYHKEKNLLLVPTISQRVRNLVMSQLVRACESAKTTAIHVSEAKGSLTTRLEAFIASGEQPFDEFEVGHKAILIGPGSKTTFDIELLDHAAEGIKEAIASGAQVSEIALSAHGVAFKLTHDFLLKGISFLDGAIDYEADDDEFNTFEQEAGAQLLLVSNVVDSLCQMFDYKPPVESDDNNDLF